MTADKTATPVRPQIKVCGVREAAEAAALDAMGVDWIGFNFHPGSARYIDPEAAAALVRGLKRAKAVGVFVDADPRRVADVVKLTGIAYAQLHGAEDWDYIGRMPVPVIKAVPHARLQDLGGLRSRLEAGQTSQLRYLMIDTVVEKGGGFGGTGKSFDWSLLSRHPLPLPYFLAGGLGPDNLAAALKACAPFAVDLNSKVETAPGRKNLDLVKACADIVAAR